MNQSFHRSAFGVALFAMLSYGVDYSYQLVDMYWVAKLGVGAPTAVLVVAAVFFLIFVSNNVVGVSSVALISQAFGREQGVGNFAETERLILQTLLFKVFIGCVFVLVFWGFLRWGVGIYSVDPVVVGFIQAYGGVLWVSLVLFAVHTSCMTALRSIGEARVTFWISLVAFSVNFVVNPVLIFGWLGVPALGIAGAAWATVLAQVVAIGLAFWGLSHNRAGVRVFRWHYVAVDLGVYKQLVLIGLPVLGMMFLMNFEQALLAGIVAQHGAVVSDGFGVGARIFGLLFMLNFGVTIGVSVAVGQFVGRGDGEIVYRALPRFVLMAALVAGVIAGLVAWFAPVLVGLFVEDAESIGVGVEYLRFMAPVSVAVCVRFGFSGVFAGAGRNGPMLSAALIMFVLVEFPLLWVFHRVGVADLYQLWLVVLVSSVIGAMVLGWHFWRRRWMPTGT